MSRPVLELIVPERHRRSYAAAVNRILTGSPEIPVVSGPLEMIAMHADGREFPVEVSVAALHLQGGMAFGSFVRDISDRKRMEARLLERGLTDELTALPNRALLGDRLDRALSRLARSGSSLAVISVDVDRFKVVNDSLGHAAGDLLLRAIAVRFHAAIRPTDTVARFGGDEFVVICEDVDEVQALGLARRLLDALERPIELMNHRIHAGASMGIVLTQDPARAADDLLRDADAAMYRAKRNGGGRAELFDAATRIRALARLEMEADLRDAIDGGELHVEFQPILRLDPPGAHGVEALVRWNHAMRGRTAPSDFIPVAEETGLIVPLGAFVLDTACRQLAAWDAEGLEGLSVAVNLSGRQLAEAGIVDVVRNAVCAAGIEPGRLCLEITESVLMEDTTAAVTILGRLHELGVNLAVDDFGTGYSSLVYLRRFPVQQLKLDTVFISGLGRSREDTTIVKTVIDLAHALGLEAVAEGVETQEQLTALRAMGCDLGQGYLCSGPVAAPDIAGLVRGRGFLA
jgi:diguanylate cyclase (GGDEF)-like protein